MAYQSPLCRDSDACLLPYLTLYPEARKMNPGLSLLITKPAVRVADCPSGRIRAAFCTVSAKRNHAKSP
jgi:hypothetical protein